MLGGEGQPQRGRNLHVLPFLSVTICKFTGTWDQGSSRPHGFLALGLALPHMSFLSEREVAVDRQDMAVG